MGTERLNCRPHRVRVRVRERGAIAIIVALSLAVMIGFAGLALDLGRLFVNKTELQSAADACALAASRELICDPAAGGACPTQFLLNAETAGISAASRNTKDLQASAVTVAAADVRFHTDIGPNGAYATRGGASGNSKFVMCTARSNGLVPWLMGAVGLGAANNVAASAVSTLAPSQNFCLGPPIGVCRKVGGAAPNFGYAPGEWIESEFTTNGDQLEAVGGAGFKWVDFTPNAGGNTEIRDGLLGTGGACNIKVNDNVDVVQPGQQQGAKSAYNTRFGMYPSGANAYTPADAPPDRTGYSYPSKTPANPAIPLNTSAYLDYRARQAAFSPFEAAQYAPSGAAGNIPGNPINSATHQSTGGNRRLIAVPVVNDCANNNTPIVGTICVLMLNPMSNGATGTIYLEYRGNATLPGSPCGAFGSPGGPNSLGPLVPTLVQ